MAQPIWHRCLLHPIISALISLAVIVAGLLGSIWTEEIKSAMPFSVAQLAGPTWRVTLFWALAFGSTATFFFRQTAIDRERRSAQGLLSSRANELKDLIQTLPPRSFLDRFASLYEQAERAAVTAGAKRFCEGNNARRSAKTPHPSPEKDPVRQSCTTTLRCPHLPTLHETAFCSHIGGTNATA